MALLVQFGELITSLKEELDLSTNVGVGVDKRPQLMRAINRVYANLYNDYDWPHLKVVSDREPLSAGERFYDFPATIDFSRVEQAHVWYNDKPLPLTRGIGVNEYNALDPDVTGDRNDPAQRWEMHWKETAVQYEIWPVPLSNNQEIQWTGRRKITALVNNEDTCLLDSEVVILFAAARLLAARKSPDADLALDEAKTALINLRKRTGPSRPISMNRGEPNDPTTRPMRSTVVISG